MKDALTVLGIETSCDETAAAVVDSPSGKISTPTLRSNIVSSQLALHAKYSGIVPELASRAHLQKIAKVIEAACEEAGVAKLDAVAYTRGPGLMGPLLVGKVAAETLSRMVGCPIVPVNHLEGHIFAVELTQTLAFPLIGLIVSGGHTDLILARAPGRYKVLGRTRDDAAGEAYDKIARLLNLGYPGGPVVDRLAKTGDPKAVPFPRPYMPETWDFSFAGLKTSVLYYLQREQARYAKPGKQLVFELPAKETADVCASFQEAVADTLVWKALKAAKKYGVKQIALGGGVAANSRLREHLTNKAAEAGFTAVMPPPRLCTDNGAMIAQAAIHRLRAGRVGRVLRCDPSMPFENWAR